jgi:putative membrane protein insertion efficiency factor
MHNFFKKIVLGLIKFYQNFASPSLGRNCRFYPSCSEYSCQAIEKYGLLKGLLLGAKRILKCHPFAGGGVDLP